MSTFRILLATNQVLNVPILLMSPEHKQVFTILCDERHNSNFLPFHEEKEKKYHQKMLRLTVVVLIQRARN